MDLNTLIEIKNANRERLLEFLTRDHIRHYELGTVPSPSGGLLSNIACLYGMNRNLPRFSYEQNQVITKAVRSQGFEFWYGDLIKDFKNNNSKGYYIEEGTASGPSWNLCCFRERSPDISRIGSYKTDDLSGWCLDALLEEAEIVVMFDMLSRQMQQKLIEKLF